MAETRARVRRRSRRACVALALLSAVVGGAGCFIQQEDDTDGSGSDITTGPDIATALKSTIILADGCTAAKVGPRHLVTAARCVSGKAAFAAGQTIKFKQADGATQNPPTLAAAATATPDTGTTDPSADPDAGDTTGDTTGDDDDSTAAVPDSGTSTGSGTVPSPKAKTSKKNTSTKQGTIEQVIVHPSYTDKCGTTPCALGTGAGSDAHDLAVIVLDAELVNVPTIPVDLDTVGPGDPVVMLGSGCSRFDSSSAGSMKGVSTVAAAPKSAGHKGGPYASDTTKLSTLDSSYVVTPGSGWADQTAASICANDVGAPLFRGSTTIAVAGVTANYTLFDSAKVLPVTVEHTRVDATSKMGAWLTAQGVTTTKSCGGTCTKNTFDGGIPSPDGTKSNNASNTTGTTSPSDAGGDALAAADAAKKSTGTTSNNNNDNTADQPTGQVPLPPTPDESPPPANDGGDVDAGPPKAAKKAGGCSAAPGDAPGGSGLALGFGLAAMAVVARRRRRS